MPSDSLESVYNPHTSSHGLAGVELTKPPLNALTSNQSNCNVRLTDPPGFWLERCQFCAEGSASVGGLRSGRLTSSNEGMWVLFHHDSSAAPQTVQTASPVCGTKNFVSVRLYSAPQLHRTIVAILGICPRGTPDQPQYLCDHSPLGGVVRLEG